jgi:hypothetical protein
MMTLTLPIARTTFLECVRQPVYFVLVALCGILMTLTVAGAGFTLGYTETGEVSGDDKLLLDLGLATIFGLGVLLAGFVATSAVSREIENKTVLTIVSKPVPRWTLVVGKWLGVTAAVVCAAATMLLYLLLGIQHGVLMNASDKLHMPVVVLGLSGVFVAMGLGVWGSFFYGWSFPQVSTLAALPATLVAYVLAVCFNREWAWQGFGHGVKWQVVVAALALLMSMPVLTSIAVAASTRLGQVMTIVVCFGVFVLGLLSAGLVGSRAFENEPIGQVASARPFDNNQRFATMRNPGDKWIVNGESAFSQVPKPGDAFYFAASPNGVDRPVPDYTPWTGGMGGRDEMMVQGVPPALVITDVNERELTVLTIGGSTLDVARPPRQGDYLFLTPTKVNAGALAAWGMVPNLQFFWLLDAVNQNQPVPPSHLGLIALYSLSQVAVFLSLAVVLFQGRDVG